MPDDYGNPLTGGGRNPSSAESYARGLDPDGTCGCVGQPCGTSLPTCPFCECVNGTQQQEGTGGGGYGNAYCCGDDVGNCYNWYDISPANSGAIFAGELCVSCCHFNETYFGITDICEFGQGGPINVKGEDCSLALEYSTTNLPFFPGGAHGLPGCNNYYRPNNRPPIDDPTDLRYVPNDDGNGNAAYPPNDDSGVPGGGLISNCDPNSDDTNPHYCGACKYQVIQKEKQKEFNGGVFDCENFEENGIPNENACLPTSSAFLGDVPTLGDPDNRADNNEGHANFAMKAFHTRQANKLESCCASRDAIRSLGANSDNLNTFFPGIIYDNRPNEVKIPGLPTFDGAGFYQNPFKDDASGILDTANICDVLEALGTPCVDGVPPDGFN